MTIKTPFWITSLLCCTLLALTTAQAQLQKLYLHPKATATIMQSQVIDSIRFIPLQQQAGDEVSMYNNVQITRDYLLINDYQHKTLFVYTKDGTFVKRIEFKKLGENMYPKYQEQNNQLVFFGNNKNYTLTPKDRIQIGLDWNNPRNKKYFKKYTINLDDTTFAIQKDVVNERDIIRANPFEEEGYWSGKITTSPLYKDSLDYELKIYRNNELKKSFFPYNRIDEPRFLFTEEQVGLIKTQTPGTYMVTRPFCDTVYKMISYSIFPYYQLVMPLENIVPASFRKEPFKSKTDRENFARNNSWMFHQVFAFYETQSFIYFLVSYMGNYESYVYHKKANVTYNTNNIKADSSQYNMKLLSEFGVVTRDQKFYKVLKAGDLLAFFTEHRQAKVPVELKNFLSSKPQNNAPVLVEFTFKN